MNCPKCKIEMKEGEALISSFRFGCFPSSEVLNFKTTKLQKCLKCPECGHSDDAIPGQIYELVQRG